MGSMGGAGERDEAMVRVKVSKREVVAAVLPLQEHWLPLSNLDLLLPPVDVSVFFCYIPATASNSNIDKDIDMMTTPPAPLPTFGSMVGALKVSLAQVLISYYAFAGEVVVNSAGEPELLCNNSGVDFIEAFADIRLHHLNLYNPDDSVEGKLVPSKKRGVLAVQATEFKCGGLVVACTFDHRIADAYSANMFLSSWAEMCRSSSISVHPTFRRSLLYPRHQSTSNYHLDPAIDDMYVTLSNLSTPPPPPESPLLTADVGEDQLVSRIYYVPADQLRQLQLAASSNDCKRTKLESFSSFLWKMVAQSSSFRSEDHPASSSNPRMSLTSKMGIVVDGRTKLRGDLSSYFGNVLSIPFGEKSVSELAGKPLSWIADGVHEFLQAAATEEHFLGLIDWVEAHRPEPSLARIYCKGTEDGPAFVVSSGQRFPVADINFGWGRPAFASYHFPWGGDAGYVMPMPSPLDNDDWIVYMHLPKWQLLSIEMEAAHVFRPLTFHYLIKP
ncbi:shikimate O-hydroxycinnamoyltransferase-like [Punica granatum]|uniref:Shikimate O-hydroxycinnamoyltransferase-like n=1 Tax=Punica granatum TaxID=22663 RepID=A0A6P8CGW4_PUNGR|nr:shikimate O-hydroxycinnamoyltransferase-like [Punica granatum]